MAGYGAGLQEIRRAAEFDRAADSGGLASPIAEPSPTRGIGWRRLAMAPGNAFETREVVGDGHGEGEQFLQSLPGLEELDGNAARFQTHALGEVFELLGEDGDGGLDQEWGPFQPFLVKLGQDPGDFALALDLIEAVVAVGEPAQAGDQEGAVGEAAGADAVGDGGGHDLLSAAAADAQEELDGGAIDEGAGKDLQLPDDLVDFAVPGGFGGHG